MHLVDAGTNAYMMGCFAAGTPIRTPSGHKNIEDLEVGDEILSRNEYDPDGPIEVQRVEERFVRVAEIVELHVGGQVIRTTAEHPFWVKGKGWTAARLLEPGSLLSTHERSWLRVEAFCDIGGFTTVFNVRVSNDHTYFVGTIGWPSSLWSHNAYGGLKPGPETDNRFGHNRMIRQVARQVTAKGDTVIRGGRGFDGVNRKEVVIATLGGVKNSRRPDILVQRPDGSIYGINVGRKNAAGLPVLRERQAIQDLNEFAGLEMQFVGFGSSV